MEHKRTFLDRLLGRNRYAPESLDHDLITNKPEKKKGPVIPPGVPSAQISRSSTGDNNSAFSLHGKSTVIMEFAREAIPVIRELSWANPDVSQALDNVVTLGNTGYEIIFDEDVAPEQGTKMRLHIEEKMKEWSQTVGGRSGLVNRMFRQAMIGGAIANEWVPNRSLTGIRKIAFVRPEDIYFKFDAKKQEFFPYQKVKTIIMDRVHVDGMIALNPKTFKYWPLQGDDDSPYGIPHYLSALRAIEIQEKMQDNINFIVTQLGLVGFMQMLLEKPDRQPNESEEAYKGRLETLLIEARNRIAGGVREGIMVGFKEDVEFEFNTATKSVSGVNEIFQENELQIASGLKMDASLLGRNYSGSEGQITVVLNKQISQLTNIQNLVAENLEFGITLELLFAGFKFKTCKIKFNPSTLLDDMKLQQGQEVKIRNAQAKYNMGVTGQHQAANELGYKKPNAAKPRVETDLAGKAVAKKKREDGKNASDRAGRKKKRPVEKSQKAKGTRNN